MAQSQELIVSLKLRPLHSAHAVLTALCSGYVISQEFVRKISSHPIQKIKVLPAVPVIQQPFVYFTLDHLASLGKPISYT